jgi:drug/metabolite transporter (DMT)-like permease
MTLGVLWLGLCLAGIALAPFALNDAWQSFDPAGLPYVVATGLIHAAYFGLLAASYRRGELSVVYPMARGTGVAGTALVAGAVTGEGITASGALGIGSVCLGVLALGLPELRRPAQGRSCVLAVLVGLTVTAYSVVDKLGVGRVSPVVYLAGLAAVTGVVLAPFVLLHYGEECREAWREHERASLGVGLGSTGTYLLILAAFRQAHAGYVVAARELAVAVAVALGVAVLREPLTVPKALSAAAILAGVVLVKVARFGKRRTLSPLGTAKRRTRLERNHPRQSRRGPHLIALGSRGWQRK